MIGNPKFQIDDTVEFRWNDTEVTGSVTIVDRFGTFEQSEEVSYDIFVAEQNTLYKHILESDVTKRL